MFLSLFFFIENVVFNMVLYQSNLYKGNVIYDVVNVVDGFKLDLSIDGG